MDHHSDLSKTGFTFGSLCLPFFSLQKRNNSAETIPVAVSYGTSEINIADIALALCDQTKTNEKRHPFHPNNYR